MLVKNKNYAFLIVGAVMLLIIAACTPETTSEAPEPLPTSVPTVKVSDQDIQNESVVIAEVVSNGPGWLVVHADADGGPGVVIGHAALVDGVNENVVVEVDTSAATQTLYAMLHIDKGSVGTYEFPGEDGPVSVGGSVVTPSFQVGNLMAEIIPMVEVSDQDLVNDTVTIDRAVSSGPGWLVVHADADGAPGAVIGHAALEDGVNEEVIVVIDTSAATQTLYAMLHLDAGTIGTYEFPGDDGPVSVEGVVVTPAFNIMLEMGSTMGEDVTVMVATNPDLGEYLVDSEGMTLYLFTQDGPGKSNCNGACLASWPPLTIEGEPVAGEGVTGILSTITLDDGSMMVTYDDAPLYYYAADREPGDILGQGVGGVWYTVEP